MGALKISKYLKTNAIFGISAPKSKRIDPRRKKCDIKCKTGHHNIHAYLHFSLQKHTDINTHTAHRKHTCLHAGADSYITAYMHAYSDQCSCIHAQFTHANAEI